MKRNGFTIIEMLAVLCIIGLLIILGVPGYMSVYVSIRRNNYHSKIKEIEVAAAKYGSAQKDEIKAYYDSHTTNKCREVDVGFLIKQGYLASENAAQEYMKNPTTGGNMDGMIFLCYDYDKYDVTAHYAVEFDKQGSYYVGEKVYDNSTGSTVLYDTVIDYIGSTTCTPMSGIKDHPSGYGHSGGLQTLQNCETKRQGAQMVAAPNHFFRKLNL